MKLPLEMTVWDGLIASGGITVRRVWSEDTEIALFNYFWSKHLSWLSDRVGWKHAYAMFSVDDAELDKDRHHRTINRLIEFVHRTGFGNAHFGLTSSDVEDNVRRCQLAISGHVIDHHLQQLVAYFFDRFGEAEVLQPAFTHWQPAGDIKLGSRISSWFQPLKIESLNLPPIHGKCMGGAVGDKRVMLSLGNGDPSIAIDEIVNQNCFPWRDFQMSAPWNTSPIQSSDHVDELDMVNWFAKIAALIYKVAADMRFLASHGLIQFLQPEGYIGSSSITCKSNPYVLEKICSKARVVMSYPPQVLAVLAHNGLERTLDTSWQMRHSLAESCYILDELLCDFLTLAPSIEFVITKAIPIRHAYSSESVIRGQGTRMDEFLRTNRNIE